MKVGTFQNYADKEYLPFTDKYNNVKKFKDIVLD